ncbi:hypothetical protein F4803DRAFT_529743 [Xylaria telfairii]|nr:hypothetical protein F4803DRAFT_529743 [Xylaria telfairii]
MKSVSVVAGLLTCANAAAISQRQSLSNPLYYFAFGDSYTATAFNNHGTQPSPGNPLGNPPLGQGTFAGGPNYVGWLATKYNSTTVLAYDFAVGGATITNSLIPTTDPNIHTFEQQVKNYFEPQYTSGNSPGKIWRSDNAIFSIFFGINDIGLPLTAEPQYLQDMNTRIPQLLDYYFSLCENLYNQGARRFMFVGVPPSDRSPYIQGLGGSVSAQWSSWANNFNGQLAARIPQFTGSHAGSVAATYDYHRWMLLVLDSPNQWGFPDASCINGNGVSCIWWNNYHPGSRFNDLLAQRMLPAMNSLGFDGRAPTGGYFY